MTVAELIDYLGQFPGEFTIERDSQEFTQDPEGIVFLDIAMDALEN